MLSTSQVTTSVKEINSSCRKPGCYHLYWTKDHQGCGAGYGGQMIRLSSLWLRITLACCCWGNSNDITCSDHWIPQSLRMITQATKRVEEAVIPPWLDYCFDMLDMNRALLFEASSRRANTYRGVIVVMSFVLNQTVSKERIVPSVDALDTSRAQTGRIRYEPLLQPKK